MTDCDFCRIASAKRTAKKRHMRATVKEDGGLPRFGIYVAPKWVGPEALFTSGPFLTGRVNSQPSCCGCREGENGLVQEGRC